MKPILCALSTALGFSVACSAPEQGDKLTGASGAQHPHAAPSSVIGSNDLVAVLGDFSNLPKVLQGVAPAVGRLSTPCTVTHIGNGRAVTAAHCVPASETSGCKGLTVAWNDLELRDTEVPCEGVEWRQFGNGADVAVLRFARFPKTRIEVAADLQNVTLLRPRALTSLSHPGGGPLKWSGLCASLEVRAKLGSTEFAHDCDTQSGSSGASILDAETGRIVGIHSAGVSASGQSYNQGTFARVVR